MNAIGGFIQRLTSRKFLLTVATALILVANEQWAELVVLVSGYIGIEGVGDAVSRYSVEKTKQAAVETSPAAQRNSGMVHIDEPDDDDLSQVIPGTPSAGDVPL